MGVATNTRIVQTTKHALLAPWTSVKIVTFLVAIICLFSFSCFSFPWHEGTAQLRFSSRDKKVNTPGNKVHSSWDEIAPSRDITWQKCFGDFDCARLDVPLDWLDPSDNAR